MTADVQIIEVFKSAREEVVSGAVEYWFRDLIRARIAASYVEENGMAETRICYEGRDRPNPGLGDDRFHKIERR